MLYFFTSSAFGTFSLKEKETGLYNFNGDDRYHFSRDFRRGESPFF